MKKTSRPTNNESAVGYRRPPKHAQFKPGQSGNPKGRPRRDRSPKGIFSQLLAVKIQSGDGKMVTMGEAIMRHLVFAAAKGDHRARTQVLNLMDKWELDAGEFLHHVTVELVRSAERHGDSDLQQKTRSKPSAPLKPRKR